MPKKSFSEKVAEVIPAYFFMISGSSGKLCPNPPLSESLNASSPHAFKRHTAIQ